MIIRVMAAIIAALLLFGWIQTERANSLKQSNETLGSNNSTLLDSVNMYKTVDSLNAATVGDLNLTLEQFKRYRASDAKLIETLRTDKRNLQSVSTTQTRTINRLKGQLKDSVRVRPIPPSDPGGDTTYLTDTLKCLDINEPWFSLNGCIEGNSFAGTHVSRDSLVIAVTVEYKRFLGFLWRTKKVKNRKVDVVSRNPGTEIQGVEFIEIIK